MTTAHTLIATSAWGHNDTRLGRTRIPAGWVGVLAEAATGSPYPPQHFHLVPEAEYDRQGPEPLAVDPACHPVWPALPDEPDQPVTVMAGHGSHKRGTFVRPLYAMAAPHQGRTVGELWHYQAAGNISEHWRVWVPGKGCTIPDYATPEEALAAAGLAFAPYAAVDTPTAREPRRVFLLDESMHDEYGYRPSIVVEGEPGHTPCNFTWGHNYPTARAIAADANRELGHSPDDVRAVIASSLAVSRIGGQ